MVAFFCQKIVLEQQKNRGGKSTKSLGLCFKKLQHSETLQNEFINLILRYWLAVVASQHLKSPRESVWSFFKHNRAKHQWLLWGIGPPVRLIHSHFGWDTQVFVGPVGFFLGPGWRPLEVPAGNIFFASSLSTVKIDNWVQWINGLLSNPLISLHCPNTQFEFRFCIYQRPFLRSSLSSTQREPGF